MLRCGLVYSYESGERRERKYKTKSKYNVIHLASGSAFQRIFEHFAAALAEVRVTVVDEPVRIGRDLRHLLLGRKGKREELVSNPPHQRSLHDLLSEYNTRR